MKRLTNGPAAVVPHVIRLLTFATIAGTALLSPVQAKSDHDQRVDFSRLVVVGDSLSAGFQNFSLFDSDSAPGVPPGGQKHGYAALVATQAQASLPAALFTFPGIPPALMLTPLGKIVRGTTTGNRENPAEQTHNLSVPGFTVRDVLSHPFPGNPQAPVDAMSDLILGVPGNAVPGCGPIPGRLLPPTTPSSALGVSQAVCAVALKPTTILMSVGSNDALQSLTFGTNPTDPGVFAVEYALLLAELSSTHATIVASNIPDVGSIPFLIPVPVFKATCPSPVVPLPFNITNADFVVLNITDPTVSSFDICANYSVRTHALIAKVQSAVTAYNKIIELEAKLFNVVVVDVNSLFANIAAHGYTVNGRTLTTGFLGGIFSLDGIHPTNTGYAILANETIKTMNQKLHTTIPTVSVPQIALTDPLILPMP